MQSTQPGSERRNETQLVNGAQLDFHRSSENIKSYQELQRIRNEDEARESVRTALGMHAANAAPSSNENASSSKTLEAVDEGEYIRKGISDISAYINHVRSLELMDSSN
ncbi:hypothetical protein H6796_02240 [Candidatus Nomurabacteria bacterium]|nr:hypothetical protein [Candidatus Nomurabacteria bacterium]